MGQFFDDIPAFLIPWIEAQKVFWVATSPLAEDGHVNVSPKGCFDKTFNVVLDDEEETDVKQRTSKAVWYEDLTGSGVETIAHLRENGRVTLMFTAFEGPPRIVRLFGTGKVYEYGTPEYNNLLPADRRQPGSRAVIWVDVHKVGSSCGYSIPFFEYKAPRVRLHKFAMGREQLDFNASCELSSSAAASSEPPTVLETGMKGYWKKRNLRSIDGLPGMMYAFYTSAVMGDWDHSEKGKKFKEIEDDEREPEQKVGAGVKTGSGSESEQGGVNWVFGFGFGVLVGIAATRWASRV